MKNIDNETSKNKTSIGCGCGLGNIIALALSIVLKNSILWNVLHFLFGWFYVVWAIIIYFHELLYYFF